MPHIHLSWYQSNGPAGWNIIKENIRSFSCSFLLQAHCLHIINECARTNVSTLDIRDQLNIVYDAYAQRNFFCRKLHISVRWFINKEWSREEEVIGKYLKEFDEDQGTFSCFQPDESQFEFSLYNDRIMCKALLHSWKKDSVKLTHLPRLNPVFWATVEVC